MCFAKPSAAAAISPADGLGREDVPQMHVLPPLKVTEQQ